MKTHIILLSALLLAGTVKAQSSLPGRTEILEAIEGCTTYATSVLLDESGKSRCDYNMVQGKWYPYEEPWHTGQLILGLLDAYEITKSPQALAAARKAGDWWVGLEIKDNPALKGMVGATHGDDIGNDKINRYLKSKSKKSVANRLTKCSLRCIFLLASRQRKP